VIYLQSRPLSFSPVEPKLVPEILSYYATGFRCAYQVRSGLNVQHTTEQKRLPKLKNWGIPAAKKPYSFRTMAWVPEVNQYLNMTWWSILRNRCAVRLSCRLRRSLFISPFRYTESNPLTKIYPMIGYFPGVYSGPVQISSHDTCRLRPAFACLKLRTAQGIRESAKSQPYCQSLIHRIQYYSTRCTNSSLIYCLLFISILLPLGSRWRYPQVVQRFKSPKSLTGNVIELLLPPYTLI
jgi:hypothetical protein